MTYARRAKRRLDQARGYPFSAQRPGVVLMLHVGRCGSTVLANMLAQNPQVHWDAKLHRKARGLYGDRTKVMDFKRWTESQFAISGARYYGFEFKVLSDQYAALLGTTPQAFLEACKSMGVTHYILLVRRNTLRHVVSNYASRNRGMWHSSNSDAVRQQQFTLDTNRISTGSAPGRPLVEYLQEVDGAHGAVRSSLQGENLLELEYETDIEEKGAEFAYRKVCRFLDVEPIAARARNRRLNPYPLESTLTNYEEISRLLRGTKFEWMLERDSGSDVRKSRSETDGNGSAR